MRIVDVSEGGLCLLSPLWLDPKRPIALAIEVPGRGTATVQIEVWHIRREKSRTSAGKIWIAGAILRGADGAYAQLLEATGLGDATRPRCDAPSASATTAAPPTTAITSPSSSPTAAARSSAPNGASAGGAPRARPGGPVPPLEHSGSASPLDAVEPNVFRLRCKAKGSPRTRVLTLAAEFAEEARRLAERDLGDDWDVLEVLEA